MIHIKVVSSDLVRILAAIDMVGQVVVSEAKRFIEESAKEFADQLKSNITSQKYGDFGKPHGRWKKGQLNENMYWLWLGTVLKSIRPWDITSMDNVIKWFVGLKFVGSGISTMSTGRRKIIKFKEKISPQQVRIKAILQERSQARRVAATGVVHISPVGYVPQQKSRIGQQIGGGKPISLGKEVIRKRILSDTSSD